ncbi:hypothetical protein FB1_27840 [Flavobacterium branchiophilum NBRC 15030 = ATCC 35035]|uniref:Uncharacterized protein n=1 Tax=Flavobacterium branchiophilum TaxID=55197 RepID=A0A2H3KWI6_9FLAO|nr:hypothetical protein B0A77_10685 [Flavobacterium branchiophilum]TQM40345.1 hypothetical protein BC670_1228 [Flavobacterium branchiophilum]GEM56563.1 hypothetical protein FB1_27840 [Flavobacterium branchiophilum NBRC 15030 = ATCC 35035]
MQNPFNKIKTTIIFFAVYFILTILINTLIPGDMCNPGGGFLMIFLLIPITIILIFFRIVKYHKEH